MNACEACTSTLEGHPGLLWHLSDDEVTYILCPNCLSRLVSRALSPKQFHSLLKNGHLREEFMLHDDFYDAAGNALQPYQ